jgi:hypothetical protein
MNAVATELQDRHNVVFVAAQACYTAQRLYRTSELRMAEVSRRLPSGP